MQVPLTMLMIDIDHFKRFNDSYGHVAGDACLTMVGNAVSRSVRRTVDFASRYAGEEFAVMLFHTTRAEIYRALIEATAFGARTIIERLREYGVAIERVVCCYEC